MTSGRGGGSRAKRVNSVTMFAMRTTSSSTVRAGSSGNRVCRRKLRRLRMDTNPRAEPARYERRDAEGELVSSGSGLVDDEGGGHDDTHVRRGPKRLRRALRDRLDRPTSVGRAGQQDRR